MSVKTVQVNNVSLGAKEQDIKEFFSFSGDIEYLEMKGESERSQVAYVTFKDPQSAETAVLLSEIAKFSRLRKKRILLMLRNIKGPVAEGGDNLLQICSISLGN